MALCLLCSALAFADCYLGGPAIVGNARDVTEQINSLNELAARDIAQANGPVCANTFTEKPDITIRFSSLLNCSGPDAEAKTLNDRVAPNLALAKMFLSAAINKGLCVDALNFRLELLKRFSAAGASNTGDDQRVAAMESLLRTTTDSADRLGRSVQSLLPIGSDNNNADALAVLGALYMQPMLPLKNEDLAADYLYRAAVAYLDVNQRDKAIKMLSGLDSMEAGRPLAEKIRARVYGDDSR
jgi:hypothetical protein